MIADTQARSHFPEQRDQSVSISRVASPCRMAAGGIGMQEQSDMDRLRLSATLSPSFCSCLVSANTRLSGAGLEIRNARLQVFRYARRILSAFVANGLAKPHCYLARKREGQPSLLQFKKPAYLHRHNRHIQAVHH